MRTGFEDTTELAEPATAGNAAQASSTRGLIGWGPSAVLAAAVLGAILTTWIVLHLSLDVPDTNSPLVSNHMGVVDAGNYVGQTFIAKRNNLDRVSLLLTVEEPNDYSSVTFVIRDGGPSGPVLRSVKLEISGITVEDPFRHDVFHLFMVDPRWHVFEFEPISNSAGRTLYFSIDGKYVPSPSKVKVAMMFRSGYPEGTVYVNGDKQNAHVVFRAESRGEVLDYLGTLAENVTFDREGPAANKAIYAVLGLAYVLLLVALLGTAWRTLRT